MRALCRTEVGLVDRMSLRLHMWGVGPEVRRIALSTPYYKVQGSSTRKVVFAFSCDSSISNSQRNCRQPQVTLKASPTACATVGGAASSP
jgi:hypothetical protein